MRRRVGILVVLDVDGLQRSGELRGLVILPGTELRGVELGVAVLTLLILMVLNRDVTGASSLHGLVGLLRAGLRSITSAEIKM